uniref:ADP-ribosylation factor family protein n=1 Tax=Angiostrongylus cantonensis TaxID=6313 RepID=A0A158P5V4_ANGCA
MNIRQMALYRLTQRRRRLRSCCFTWLRTSVEHTRVLTRNPFFLEDPRDVLSTNGFSMIDMEYDDDFHIKVYDLGGHERIRDIWTNYFAEVHGIIYVVDISNEGRTASKPLLVVLNKRKPTELDDFDFTISVRNFTIIFGIQSIRFQLNNAKQPPPPVSKRSRRIASPLLMQFCVFVDKIIEHYVFLSEGVQSAEMALKLRQQAERDERRIRLMRQEQERRNSDITELEGQVKNHLTENQFTSSVEAFRKKIMTLTLIDSPSYTPRDGVYLTSIKLSS